MKVDAAEIVLTMTTGHVCVAARKPTVPLSLILYESGVQSNGGLEVVDIQDEAQEMRNPLWAGSEVAGC